jgi:hypothetical protein
VCRAWHPPEMNVEVKADAEEEAARASTLVRSSTTARPPEDTTMPDAATCHRHAHPGKGIRGMRKPPERSTT